MELIAPNASPEEAAAIAAALQQFLAETAPVVAAGPPRESAWLRTARLEAIDREPLRP